MTRFEKIKHYIETIHRSARDLSDWERDQFLPSIARQFNAKGDLSDRQLEILERIYDEKTPTGSAFGNLGHVGPREVEVEKTRRVREEGRVTPRSELRCSWREKGYDDED